MENKTYKFKIEVDIKADFNIEKEEKDLIYYTNYYKNNDAVAIHTDHVCFDSNTIIITGTRKSEIKDNYFDTVRSNGYQEVVKSLLYVFFKYSKFEVEEIRFYKEDELTETYTKDLFDQVFDIDISHEDDISRVLALQLDQVKKRNDNQKPIIYIPKEVDILNIVEAMFDTDTAYDRELSEKIMTSLMYILLASSNDSHGFNNAFSGFDALLSYWAKIYEYNKNHNYIYTLNRTGKVEIANTKDSDKLGSIRKDFWKNNHKYAVLAKYFSLADYEYLETFKTSLYILSNYDLEDSQDVILLSNRILNFRDSRLANRMLESSVKAKAYDRHENFIDEYIDYNDYNDNRKIKKFVKFINKNRSTDDKFEELLADFLSEDNTRNDDSVLASFIVLDYTYYLRNQYFHGNEYPYHFLIKNHNFSHISQMTYPLILTNFILINDLIALKNN